MLTGRITDPAGRPVAGAGIADDDHSHTVSQAYSLTVYDDSGILPLTRKIEMPADREVVLYLAGRAAPGQ